MSDASTSRTPEPASPRPRSSGHVFPCSDEQCVYDDCTCFCHAPAGQSDSMTTISMLLGMAVGRGPF